MKKHSDGQYIDYDGQEPTFFAMIPKMAIMELTPYELALYCNLKQTASEDGKCFKSNATLAKETQMSVSMIKKARQTLANKGYITIKRHYDKSGIENQCLDVFIVNVWPENHRRYAKGGSYQKTTPGHDVTTPQLPENQGVVTTQPQRITNEEEPTKNKKTARKSAAYPANVKSWKESHINNFWQEHEKRIETARRAWGINTAAIPWQDMSIDERKEFVLVERGLGKLDVTELPALVAYARQKCAWMTNMRPPEILKHITDFRNSRIPKAQPANIIQVLIDEADYPDTADYLPLDENGNYIGKAAG